MFFKLSNKLGDRNLCGNADKQVGMIIETGLSAAISTVTGAFDAFDPGRGYASPSGFQGDGTSEARLIRKDRLVGAAS